MWSLNIKYYKYVETFRAVFLKQRVAIDPIGSDRALYRSIEKGYVALKISAAFFCGGVLIISGW